MAEAKDNAVNEEPKVLTVTEKVDDKDVEKQYLIEDISEEGLIFYNKLAIIQKQKNDMVTNAQFEIEKADVLINHFMAELKNNLPEEMEAIDEDAKSGDKKPNWSHEVRTSWTDLCFTIRKHRKTYGSRF